MNNELFNQLAAAAVVRYTECRELLVRDVDRAHREAWQTTVDVQMTVRVKDKDLIMLVRYDLKTRTFVNMHYADGPNKKWFIMIPEHFA